jgi:hypothetical protein
VRLVELDLLAGDEIVLANALAITRVVAPDTDAEAWRIRLRIPTSDATAGWIETRAFRVLSASVPGVAIASWRSAPICLISVEF